MRHNSSLLYRKEGETMNTTQLNAYHQVFFIGIGGISMSGLAEVLNQDGKIVSGSDQNLSDITNNLETLGIKVFKGHTSDHINKKLDLVVYTAAIKEDNVELMKAKELGIPMMERATLLGLIMDGYKTSIGVAGTHGKTTTTSMISHIMLEGKLDPTISVGAILKGINGNFRVGQSDYFVTEACEYANSYLKFFPNISLVLNVEEDHLDFFKDIDDIRHSFKTYLGNTKTDGLIIINDSIPHLEDLLSGIDREYMTIGKSPASTYSYQNPSFDEDGLASFYLFKEGVFLSRVHLKVTGYHNIENALAAIATGLYLCLNLDTIQKGLLAFGGANRRFEYKGSFHDVSVIDDYAHHPTEIRKTLEAAQKIKHRELWVVFQPHTYTRTKAFYEDFVQALSSVDHLILTDIYAAREKDPGDIHSKMLVESLSKFGKDIVYIDDFEKIKAHLVKNLVPKDMLITMGAGNVNLIGEILLEE
jgi:UDP-N-acetylmuramate--alanine ligase